MKMTLERNIERFRNKEIHIEEVLYDFNGNSFFSLEDNSIEIKKLLNLVNLFNDKHYMFKKIFCYEFESIKKNEDILKEILIFFIDDLQKHIEEFSYDRNRVILNILPLLSSEDLNYYMPNFTRMINIVEINSEDMRNKFLQILKNQCISKEESFEEIVISITEYINGQVFFDSNIIKNIISTIELMDKNDIDFVSGLENAFINFRNKFVDLISFKIEKRDSIPLELIEEYIVFLKNKIEEKGMNFKDIISPIDKDDKLFRIEPAVFKIVIDNLKNTEIKEFVKKSIKMFDQNEKLNPYKANYNDNKKYLYLKNTQLEKEELMKQVKKTNISSKKKRI